MYQAAPIPVPRVQASNNIRIYGYTYHYTYLQLRQGVAPNNEGVSRPAGEPWFRLNGLCTRASEIRFQSLCQHLLDGFAFLGP
jgi:hypothetical protein